MLLYANKALRYIDETDVLSYCELNYKVIKEN